MFTDTLIHQLQHDRAQSLRRHARRRRPTTEQVTTPQAVVSAADADVVITLDGVTRVEREAVSSRR